MYNDERNLYHYTYRRDGSETVPPLADGGQSAGPRPVQEMKPMKKNKIGLKVTALALSCALLGRSLARETVPPRKTMLYPPVAAILPPP